MQTTRLLTRGSEYRAVPDIFVLVGPPEECLITGFDRDGEVLIGWSFFKRPRIS